MTERPEDKLRGHAIFSEGFEDKWQVLCSATDKLNDEECAVLNEVIDTLMTNYLEPDINGPDALSILELLMLTEEPGCEPECSCVPPGGACNICQGKK